MQEFWLFRVLFNECLRSVTPLRPCPRNFLSFMTHEIFIVLCTSTCQGVLPCASWIHSKSSHLFLEELRGSFQKFCTLYAVSLKMNLFYKIHLQAFNVISIVLYHRGPTFGQVLYSCQEAVVFYVSDYSGHLIRHFLNAAEAFPTEWFLQFWETLQQHWGSV
jgi:hypothetical protein